MPELTIRGLRTYIKEVKNGDREMDHIWSHYVIKIMRKLFLWSDTDQWAKDSWLAKGIHISNVLVIFLLWPLMLARILQKHKELTISRVAQGVSISLGGFVTFFTFILANYKRDTLTTVFRTIERKFLAVPKDTPKNKEWWRRMYSIHVQEIQVLIVALLGGFMICIPDLITSIYSGVLYYETMIPLSQESYSFDWWLQLFYFTYDTMLSGIYFSFKEFLFITLLYQLSLLYEHLTLRVLDLCSKEDFEPAEELAKLKDILREQNELHFLRETLKDFLSPYLFYYFSIVSIMLAISALAFVVDMKDDILVALVTNLTYPSYALGLLVVWAFFGEHSTESVDNFANALYFCNWPDAPWEVKKLILMSQIKLTKRNFIEGRPFFYCNRELFTLMMKRTYYMLTVLIDFLD